MNLPGILKSKWLWVAAAVALAIGAGLAWRSFRTDPAPTVEEAVQGIQTTVDTLQAGLDQVLAVPEQVRREVRRNVQNVVQEVADYSVADRLSELERISRLGGAIRTGGNDNHGNRTIISFE